MDEAKATGRDEANSKGRDETSSNREEKLFVFLKDLRAMAAFTRQSGVDGYLGEMKEEALSSTPTSWDLGPHQCLLGDS